MRSFDTWNHYEDNQGNPLHGCVQFMVKDGTTVAPIYDSDGTALDNPQLTDIYGRTQHQVFIDEDCVAYFYKYIGNGIWSAQEGINTSDQTKWSLQYTIENQNTLSRTVESTGTYCVPTINDLRLLDVEDVPEINGIKVITLLGYNKLGDKEPINYYWDPESTDADNEGSIIKYEYEITGRWIMVQPTHHCDSRHFGIFPSNSYNTTEQTYRLSNLFEYCNSKGISPFLDTNGDYIWYRYRSLNVTSNNPIIVSKGIQFFDENDSTIGGEWQGNPHFVQRNTNLIAKNVKTSWDAKSYTGYENVVLDKYTDQKNWQDAHIDTRMYVYGYNFNHCTFEENGNIGSDNVNNINNTFTNCKLTERMFVTSGDYTVSLAGLCINCQIDMDDFRNNMWLYKEIRQTMDGDAFFDFRNMPNVGKPINNWGANKITSDTIWITNLKNLYANRYPLETLGGQVTTYVLENCVGYYQIPAGLNLTLLNCSVKLRLGANCVITANDSNVTLDETAIITADRNPTISLRSSTLQGDYNGLYRWKSFTSYDSIVMCANEAMSSVVKDSQINNTLKLIAEPGVPRTVTYLSNTVEVSHFIHSYLDNNIFNGKLIIDGESALSIHGAHHVLVDSLVIQNNRSNLSSLDAWEITRLGCMASDRLNYYTYVNNVGGFECTLDMHQVPIIPGATLINDSYNGMLTETLGQLIESIRWGTNISTTSTASYADTMRNYFTKMRMFIIGYYDATVDLEFSLIDNPMKGGEFHGNTDTIYLNPNVNYVADGGTVYNYACSVYGPSVVQGRLSTYSKYVNLDNSHNFIVPDLARDPYSNTEEWQIRNFILGKGPGWFTGTQVNCSLRIRQLDKKG